jgi:hypothetical protein
MFMALRDGAESQRAECKRAKRHSAESLDVDASRCLMYQSAELQRAELTRDRYYKVPNVPMCRQSTNCQTTYY